MKYIRLLILISGIIFFPIYSLAAEYSQWSFFGGLNLIYNGDGDGVSIIPGMQADGNPGGLSSAPSPLCGFIGAEYRYPITPLVAFAPSGTLYAAQYLFANNRALPAEIENRTAYVPSLLLDFSFLYHIEKGRFTYSFGGGPAIIARYGFLEYGISGNAINPGETLNASAQVDAINEYFWGYGRWFYPIVQAGIRYELETGWGAGLVIRAAIPVSNIWAKPEVPFGDSFMLMAALSITPPISKKPSAADSK